MSATIGTHIHTWLQGKLVGKDSYGNLYYEARRTRKGEKHRRRWVVYNGMAEPTKVPSAWHGWLHYTLNAPLAETKKHGWQKEHQPNLTGTKGRYLPAGHISKGGLRARAEADYEPWTPQ
jgi:NADH:ubiquinone oxidoreductase subunit